MTPIEKMRLFFPVTLVGIFMAGILMSACAAKHIHYILSNNQNGLEITCHIKKIKIKEISEKDQKIFNIKSNKQTWIYGEIQLNNTTNKDLTYDFHNYYLLWNSMQSSHLIIDSIGDILIRQETIKPHGIIKKSVYWVFNAVLRKADMEKVKLLIKPNENHQ